MAQRWTPIWPLHAVLRVLVVSVAGTMALSTALSAAGSATQSANDHQRLWQAYSGRFISAEGRVVDPEGDDRTTSEGQSYALFFALVNNDRGLFDKLASWTAVNLASGDLGGNLPAWSWGKAKDGAWRILDANSASDSDLWIAYDLIEAGRLWHDRQFAAEGRRLASLIAGHEVSYLPSFGAVLVPGEEGFKIDKTWVLNPAYSPLFILERLSKIQPFGPWPGVSAKVPLLLERSARNGFAMDWICYTASNTVTAAFTPCLKDGKEGSGVVGSYEAIRVYLWAGMLPDSSAAKARILKAIPGMDTYLKSHEVPPEKIDSDGLPLKVEAPVGFSAALVPYLEGNSDETAAAQQLVRLKSHLDEKSNLYGTRPTYYDQNLALFGTGWVDKCFEFGSSGELLVRWSR